ncbi:MAG: hypothetical protein MR333_02475, partial [Porphyromonadaceae bacterium]|nr:hypothetical protein [Porphyromonadaceae bacterium]
MKRIMLLFAAVLALTAAMAQKPQKNELNQLKTFLQAPSDRGVSNAQALNITDLGNPASWKGVKMENGYITEIDWSHKNLAGALNVSGFKNLQRINVTDNRISSLTLDNDPALIRVDAGRNIISDLSIDNCTNLQVLRVYRNR